MNTTKKKLMKATLPALFLLTMATGTAFATASVRLSGNGGAGSVVPVYERSLNPSIGITAANANGVAYTITDSDGKVVMTGNIRSARTFYIATARLATGVYSFRIGGQLMQQFIIR